MSPHSMDVTSDDFAALVIEASKTTPVLVDFWAEWCAPCRALKPVLEKLAAEYQGKFILAKVNSDENQPLAQQFGVRGIPNVKAFVGGKMVDEFSGALPEAEVRAFLNRLLPSPAEQTRAQAMALFAETGDAKAALALLAQSSSLDPHNENVRIDSAQILIALNEFDEARRLIASLSPLAQMDERVTALQARLALAAPAGDAVNTDELLARIEKDAKDSDARLRLARHYIALEQYAPALDQLLEIVRRDRKYKDDGARKTMLQLFTVLGDNPLVGDYRRKLAGALN